MKDIKEEIELIEEKRSKDDSRKTCGIVMPISHHPDYPVGHWGDVLNILREAIDGTEFEPKLVSDDDAIGLIHERIVTNIYNNEMIVCDVSSKNPNVMFELGLRLAFDKPTIIIKDEKTDYSFDTSGIEHIPYPSSLRFSQIVKFKADLISKINATYSKYTGDPNFSPFLKSFGKTIKPAVINSSEISESRYIIEQLNQIRKDIQAYRTKQDNIYDFNNPYIGYLNNDGKFQFLLYLIDKKLININVDELLGENGLFHKNSLMSQFNRYGVNISMPEIDSLLKIYLNHQLNNLNKLK